MATLTVMTNSNFEFPQEIRPIKMFNTYNQALLREFTLSIAAAISAFNVTRMFSSTDGSCLLYIPIANEVPYLPLSRLAPPATLSRKGRGKNPGQSKYISLQDYALPSTSLTKLNIFLAFQENQKLAFQ
jgi:hypothetical protein